MLDLVDRDNRNVKLELTLGKLAGLIRMRHMKDETAVLQRPERTNIKTVPLSPILVSLDILLNSRIRRLLHYD